MTKFTIGEYGVIYVVDEISTLFNSLLRRGQNISVLETISQQRKQRKHIIGTAQRLKRIDKVFREQMANVIACNKFFGCIQFNKLVDMDNSIISEDKIDLKAKKYFLWFHTLSLYNGYDTNAVISSYKDEFINSELSDEAFEVFRSLLGGINQQKNC